MEAPRPLDLTIVVDDLSGAAVRALLRDHLAAMHEQSPPGAVHALDVDALTAPDVTFWTAWDGDPGVDPSAGALAGCAALRELDPARGEPKSFRTHPAYLRRGVAAALLEHLMGEAGRRGYRWLGLETGSGSAFEAAHALYARHGFTPCGPFGDYAETPFARYFERDLSTNPSG